MKRFISFIVIAFLLAASFPVSGPGKVLSASATPTIAVEAVSSHSGDEVSVPITLSNNPGICAALIAISYGDGLELISVEDSGLLPNPVHGGVLSANPYLLSWDDSLAETDITQNGTLVILHFRVLENATEDNCNITLHYEPDNIFNLALENVHFETVDGKVQTARQTPSPQLDPQSEGGSPLVIILCVVGVLLVLACLILVWKQKSKQKTASAEGGETL